MADRCTGRCCEDFILRDSPSELHSFPSTHKDHNFILDMVLYLGFYTDGRHPDSGKAHHYTCRHFDKVTRNCMVYEKRPDMCRDFPYNKPCIFKGCELTPELRPDSLVENLFRKCGHKPDTLDISSIKLTQLVEALEEKKDEEDPSRVQQERDRDAREEQDSKRSKDDR